MGLFGFKAKYDISPNVENLKNVVHNYNEVDVIKMNAKLTVPEGYYFAVGKKGKVADIFDTGEYFFNTANLPYMCRKFNIDKIKKGKAQDKISADFYFINKGLNHIAKPTWAQKHMVCFLQGLKAFFHIKLQIQENFYSPF